MDILSKLGKMLKSLTNLKLIPICLLAYIAKTLIITPNYAESLIVLGLSALYGFWHLTESKRVPKPTQLMYEEMKVIKNQLNSMKVNMGLRVTNDAEKTKKRRF